MDMTQRRLWLRASQAPGRNRGFLLGFRGQVALLTTHLCGGSVLAAAVIAALQCLLQAQVLLLF